MGSIDKREMPTGFGCRDCNWCGSSLVVICPKCGKTNIDKKETLGKGKLVDFVSVLYPPDNLKDLGQYVSVLVEFEEGFKRFGISLDKPEDLFIGCSVTVSSFDGNTKRLFIEKAKFS